MCVSVKFVILAIELLKLTNFDPNLISKQKKELLILSHLRILRVKNDQIEIPITQLIK